MRLRLAILFSLVLLPGVAVAQTEEGIRIGRVNAERFPRVELTISFEDATSVGVEGVQVAENGVPIERFSLQHLGTSGQAVEVVLAIDTSGSMQGEPIAAAVAAAERFVQGLPRGMRVGVVAFSDDARVVQDLTDDRTALLSAIGSLSSAGETAMNDAMVEATELFSGDGQRNVILLSDGGDTASTASLDAAVAAAAEAETAVFSIGWRTTETDVAALRTLARQSGGRYASAGSDDVSQIYGSLAEELSNQYLLSYESPTVQGGQASVTVTGPGGSDTSLVLLPAAQVPAPKQAPPAPQPPEPPLLNGVWGLGVVMGLVFFSTFLVGMWVLRTGARRHRLRELARRMTVRGWKRQPAEETAGGDKNWVPNALADAAQRAAEAGGFAEGIDRRLERAGISMRAGEFVAMTGIGAVMGFVLGLLFRNVFLAFILGFLGFLIPMLVLSFGVRRRTGKLQEQVTDVLMIIASSLRAGHSFLQALDMVAKEIRPPASEEFSRAVAEIRLGSPVEDALDSMAERIGSEDFRWAVMAVNIQREVGGNLAEILDTLAETLRERQVVRRQVKVLSAEGRLSANILTVMPFLIGLYVFKVNPEYLSLLWQTPVGILVLIGAGGLMTLGVIVMRKMVKIDV